jgi:hypothetical protein
MGMKKGLLIGRMYLPSQLKIEIKRLKDDEWVCHYEETLEDVPEEIIKFTVDLAKEKGFNVERKGNTVSYTVQGGRNAVFGAILGEALALSDIGDLTLRELFILTGLGTSELKKIKERLKIERG